MVEDYDNTKVPKAGNNIELDASSEEDPEVWLLGGMADLIHHLVHDHKHILHGYLEHDSTDLPVDGLERCPLKAVCRCPW